MSSSDKPRIQQDTNGFYIGESSETANAEIRYKESAPGVIAVYLTRVDETLQGQGIAGQLFNALIDHARQKGLRIIPQCSYVAKKFEAQPDTYADVIAQ